MEPCSKGASKANVPSVGARGCLPPRTGSCQACCVAEGFFRPFQIVCLVVSETGIPWRLGLWVWALATSWWSQEWDLEPLQGGVLCT